METTIMAARKRAPNEIRRITTGMSSLRFQITSLPIQIPDHIVDGEFEILLFILEDALKDQFRILPKHYACSDDQNQDQLKKYNCQHQRTEASLLLHAPHVRMYSIRRSMVFIPIFS